MSETYQGHIDRRCVTGPPNRFPTTDTWKLSHIESRGHIWGTEASIDAPEALAAGSVVAYGWPWPTVPMPKVFNRPGSGVDRDGRMARATEQRTTQ
jgi:hypothetical protein